MRAIKLANHAHAMITGQAPALIADLPAEQVLADKGYDSAAFRDAIHAQDAVPVIPPRRTSPQVSCDYLPPYSPDFNPIEMAFSKLKSFLKKIAARTKDDLWAAIGQGIDAFTPTQCLNYFAAAGYDRD